jgi:GNAT superfamily N-acetyltransferase
MKLSLSRLPPIKPQRRQTENKHMPELHQMVTIAPHIDREFEIRGRMKPRGVTHMTLAEQARETIAYRKLWSGERRAICEHFLRLDPASRHMRFGHAVSDKFLEDYSRIAASLNAANYGCVIDGVLRGIAELRPLFGVLPAQAEAAFSIERAWQDTGIGSNFMDRIIVSARNRGISRLHMICLTDNRRMRAIAKKHRARLKFRPGEITGELVPALPDALSLLHELVDEAAGFVSLVLDPLSPA